MCADNPQQQTRPSRHPRRGEVLVEFAFIATILYLLLAGIIEFGRAMYAAQVLQQSVDQAARDLSRLPLPATGVLTGGPLAPGGTPTGVLNDPTSPAYQQVYNENFLVVPIPPDTQNPGLYIQNLFTTAPTLNKLLMPLMFFDTAADFTTNNLNNNSAPVLYFRYPGQVVQANYTTSGFTVVIPIVQYNKGTGLRNPSTDAIISVIPVVEEITTNPQQNDPNSNYYSTAPDPSFSPFNLLASNVPQGQRGMIALRVNYPFQAATLSAYTFQQDAQGNPILQSPVVTNETGPIGPNAGADGLGRLLAMNTTVRPFRKVLSFQAIFRREIFE